jgi:hypothetical protein
MRRRSIVPKSACQCNLGVDIETRCLGGICQSEVMFLAGNNHDQHKARFRSSVTEDQNTTSVKKIGTKIPSVFEAETSPASGILI